MELKKGYKQTDIGIFPEDWEILPLNDCLELLTDFEANGSFEDVAKSVRIYDAEEYAWYVRATDLEKDSSLSDVKYVDKTSYNFLHKTRLYGNEVLITKRGEIGKVYFFHMKSLHATLAPNMYLLKLNNSILPYYIYQFFKSKQGYLSLVEKNASTTLGALYKNDVKSIKIPVPSKAEQTAIAAALSDMDNLIAGLEQLIAKKKAIKQGAMQELLRPKEGWEVKKLKDLIIEFQNGFAFSAIGYETSGVPIVTMAQIGLDGSFNFDESKVNFWRIEEFNMLRNYHLVNGDLIIAMTDVTPEKNLIGRMAIVKSKETLLLNQRVGLLRLDETKVNPYILKTYSNMRSWRNYCIGAASLGVQANIGTRDILNGEIILPNIDIQNEIAEVLIDMDNELQLLEKNLEKYKLLKQGMMQELLTGKTRLV